MVNSLKITDIFGELETKNLISGQTVIKLFIEVINAVK